MKTLRERVLQRRQRERPMEMVSLHLPLDVIEDLKDVASLRGFSGWQSLIRFYIGQGLRVDLQHLAMQQQRDTIVDCLRRHGVAEETITAVVAELAPSQPHVPEESEEAAS